MSGGGRSGRVLRALGLTALLFPFPASGETPGGRKVLAEPLEPVSPASAVAMRRGTDAIPEIVAGRVSTHPRIDGILDDACWSGVQVMDNFTQVDPREGARPTERTELLVVHDRDHLFIAVRCFDSEPDKIVAAQLQNDAPVSSDDTVTLVFDTFGLKRDGYLFILTPKSAHFDALVAPGGPKTEWDAIWEGAGRIGVDGWVAEFSIPFKSLSFGTGTEPWGFNVERVIRRKWEVVRWASPFKNKSIESLADAGRLEGLTELRRGLGIDVQPFLVGRYRSVHNSSQGGDFELEPGFDAFFRLNSSITASLTVNTDFAETEVDDRRINLTRFPLFFPEKRDFFLQDASVFSFGAGNSPLPFHSRRIGLSPSGERIDIVAGAKITGRTGPLSFGLLDVEVGSGQGVPEKNLAVARASYSLGESDVGAIATWGDPGSGADNYLIGADFNYRNSHFSGNDVLTAHGWAMRSVNPDDDESGSAFGGALVYPNEPVRVDLYASRIDDNFNPALGFVKRKGIYEYGGSYRYRWRPSGFLRTVDLSAAPYVATNLSGRIETEFWTVPTLVLTNQPGDSLSLSFIAERERLSDPFEIYPGISIPRGDFRFNRISATYSSSTGRPLSVNSTVSFGDFYDGTRSEFAAGIDWRVSSHLLLAAGCEFNRIQLEAGSFDAVVAALKANIAFSPRLAWNSLIQYDNLSDTLGVNTRLRWIVRPGSDIFLELNRGFDVEDGRFQALSTEITSKVGWTFRF
jgi:hypothetical protein